MIGKTDFDFFPTEQAKESFADDKRIMESGRALVGKVEKITHPDRTQKWYSVIKLPLYDEKNQMIGTMGISYDMTRRKKAEDQVRASLKEKEVLLREIHHRVKNNLQIISSLFNLEINNVKDKQILKIFKESQNRIRTMALIHEKLYQSKNLTRIDFAEYIQSLANYLFRSYGLNPEVIKLKINVGDVFVNIDIAIPCGLIVNELVSNSMKHGFSPGREGEIRIEACSDNDKFTLIVSDNGVGFPKDLDFRNTETLGLQLVCILTDQLEGSIELDRSSGMTFTIKLPISPNQNV